MTQPVSTPNVRAQRTAFFETPVVIAELDNGEAMMASLRQSIDAHRAAHPGVQRSNSGGWHSETDMLTWGGAAARTLAEAAIGIARRITGFEGAGPEAFEWPVAMWANVSRTGDFNNLHAHPGNVWAAVFYLDDGAGEGGRAGTLYLEDPRFPMIAMRNPALRMLGADGKPQLSQVDLRAKTGTMIVFPAWLRHGVRRHNGTGTRISIAMNIDCRPKAT